MSQILNKNIVRRIFNNLKQLNDDELQQDENNNDNNHNDTTAINSRQKFGPASSVNRFQRAVKNRLSMPIIRRKSQAVRESSLKPVSDIDINIRNTLPELQPEAPPKPPRGLKVSDKYFIISYN